MSLFKPSLIVVLVLALVPVYVDSDAIAQVSTPSPCSVPSKDGSRSTPPVDRSISLDGRIGSKRESFDRVFGQPTDDDFGDPKYKFAGCDAFVVGYFEEQYLYSITAYSPRGMEGMLSDPYMPHPGDWTIEEAKEIAERFIPSDSVDKGFKKTDYGYYELVGSSELLEESVPPEAWAYVDRTPTVGGFSAILLTNNAGGVVWVEMTLNIEEIF